MNSILRWCHRILLFILPIVAVFYLVGHADALNITAQEIDFLERSYFIVVLFGLFFIVLYGMYLPTTLQDTLGLLLAPILGCVVQLLFARDQFWLYLAELGMIYTLQIALAFLCLLLIYAAVGFWNAIVHRDLGELVNTLLLLGLELLFAIPCAGAVYLFSRIIFTVILPQTLDGQALLSLGGLIVYGFWFVTFGQNMWIYFKVLYRESTLG